MICQHLGFTRQAYYKSFKSQIKKQLEHEVILERVRNIRKDLSRYGTRKLLNDITPDLSQAGISIGRDKLFNLLRENDLLVKQKKKKRVCTTNSNHPFRIHKNLLKPMEKAGIKRIYQALVADITYIRTLEGFLYLALITDLYSRKIVGHHISDSLELTGCKKALQIALKALPKQFFKTFQCVHHSDRGVQYCSYEYTDLLKKYNFQISMGRAGNCYDNAYAESVNGILKSEFNLDNNFANKKVAIKACNQSIYLYNTKRSHGSLKLEKPSIVFAHNLRDLMANRKK